MSKVNELGALEVLQKIFSATRWKLAYIRVAEGLIQKAEPIFQKCERAIVCPAFRERSYEVGS